MSKTVPLEALEGGGGRGLGGGFDWPFWVYLSFLRAKVELLSSRGRSLTQYVIQTGSVTRCNPGTLTSSGINVCFYISLAPFDFKHQTIWMLKVI